MNLTREQRLEAAERRVKYNMDHKDQYGFDGAKIFDFSKAPGGYKKDMFYRPKDQHYGTIDIIPFVVKNSNYPVKDMIGFPDYVLDIWVHRFVGASKGQFLCLSRTFGKPCPICEEIDNLMKDKMANEELIKSLQPKRRCFYNVIDLEVPEKEQKVQIFEEAHWLFEKHLLLAATTRGGGYIPFQDIEVGKSIEFFAVENKSPKGKSFNYERINLKDRPPYSESIYNQAFPLDEMLVIPTYEEVRNAFYSVEEEIEREVSTPAEPVVTSRSVAGLRGDSTQNHFSPPPPPLPSERPLRPMRTVTPEAKTCPFNHKFGEDNGAFQDCQKCDADVYDPCREAYEGLMKNG